MNILRGTLNHNFEIYKVTIDFSILKQLFRRNSLGIHNNNFKGINGVFTNL